MIPKDKWGIFYRLTLFYDKYVFMYVVKHWLYQTWEGLDSEKQTDTKVGGYYRKSHLKRLLHQVDWIQVCNFTTSSDVLLIQIFWKWLQRQHMFTFFSMVLKTILNSSLVDFCFGVKIFLAQIHRKLCNLMATSQASFRTIYSWFLER